MSTRRSLFKTLLGVAAAPIAPIAPTAAAVRKKIKPYMFPTTSAAPFVSDAARLQPKLVAMLNRQSRVSPLLSKEPFPEGIGFNPVRTKRD